MNYSVGVLYSCQVFLEKIRERSVSAIEFSATFRRLALTDTASILDLCQRCDWISVSEDGYCEITTRGQDVLQQENDELSLRRQIRDIIDSFKPSWAQQLRYGRTEVKAFLPAEIKQIFDEAGLFRQWDEDLVSWWDELSIAAYSARSIENLRVGREAESRTIAYEKERTKSEPRWISIESNRAGYDVLSSISALDAEQLVIEVKGTKQKLKEAFFYLSRHEWETGQQSRNYLFHLWVLRDPLILIPVPFSDVDKYTPLDRLDGSWREVKIPFRSFQSMKKHITT